MASALVAFLGVVPCLAGELPVEEAAIVELLRGSIGTAERVEYTAEVSLPVDADRTVEITARYHHAAGRCRVRVLEMANARPSDLIPVDAESAWYVLEPGRATVGNRRDWTAFTEKDASTYTLEAGTAPWESGPLGPGLVRAALAVDPTAWQWRQLPETTEEGWDVYEASREVTDSIRAPVAIRYSYDPQRKALMQVRGLGPEGTTQFETSYTDVEEVEGGVFVPLTSTTTVEGREMKASMQRQGSPQEATLLIPGTVAVTRYTWHAASGTRLPASREVRDTDGRLLCKFAFSDYDVRNKAGQL